MTHRWLLLFIYLWNCFQIIDSQQSILQCWTCELTKQSQEEPGTVIDECQAQFDFTEHVVSDCDGKCWKSIDLLDLKNLTIIGNTSRERLEFKDKAIAKLRSSRRCFSSDQLLQAAEIGIHTADGCRQIRRKDEPPKEICFCSDQDMCNQISKLTLNTSHVLFFCLLWRIFFQIYSEIL